MTSWRAGCSVLLAAWLCVLVGCGDGTDAFPGPREALIVVSPHPDDESIFGGATIHRMAADPNRYVRAIYMSGGDRASVPGDCNGIPEAQKTQMIVALRESETRAAWTVLAPNRDVPIEFLRGPDQGLVASSTLVGGLHVDVLSLEGETAVNRAVQIATQLPSSVRSVLFLTAAIYDAHPDHRTAYRAARQAAEILRQRRQLDVHIWSWIVHDEAADLTLPVCCGGDLHWPSAGPQDSYFALTDVPARPRPPMWNHVEDVSDSTGIRHDALAKHVSQVVGYPPLCMKVYIPTFYTRWTEKVEEPFYDEVP
jgi:LmbE family N-acetylglucosaminyl deacetylase